MAESGREEITKLEALYASNPGGRVFTHLAEAYRKAGNLARARTILEQGISKHADSASAHVVLGRVLSDLGAHEEAANSYLRVLTLDPENRVALRSLGDLSRQAGESHAALGYYRQLLHLDPSDEDLNATIQEVTRQAARPTATRDDASGVPAGAWVEPKPVAAGVPPSPAATAVTSDFALDWGTEQEEEGLPGDLGQLARAQTAAGAVAQEAAGMTFPPDIPDRDGTPGRVLEDEVPATAGFEPPGPGAMEMQPASEAEEFAAEQEQLAEASFEELLSSNAGAAAPLAAAGEEPELPTETLADLYRSQGFNERAAEVYRTLLERKPGDPELQRKLADVKALVQPLAELDAQTEDKFEEQPWALEEVLLDDPVQPEAAAVEKPAVAPTEAQVVQTGEAWLEGVASGWTESSTATGATTPYAWKDEVADDQAGGPTLGNYLQKVLAWKPTPTETPSNASLATAPITMGYSEATGARPEESPGSGYVTKVDVSAGKPVGGTEAPIAGLEPPVPMRGEEEYPSRSATPREKTPLAAPAPPTPASGPPTPRPASGNAIEDAFDEWFSSGESPQPSGSPPSGGPTAPPARSEAAAAAPDEESDDDLEMFRSWLQSLKR